MSWSIRRMEVADLAALLVVQEQGAVAGLSEVFPQDRYPFPRGVLMDRWSRELQDDGIAAYVTIAADSRLVGFAARRSNELLHFGTSPDFWGTGLAKWMHDALVATYPPEHRQLRLRVFTENRRARRFYEKLGWTDTGMRSRTSFPPQPTLAEYSVYRTELPKSSDDRARVPSRWPGRSDLCQAGRHDHPAAHHR